jgi:prepilin-type N-terminal cleavage/methylation domain-containing protein
MKPVITRRTAGFTLLEMAIVLMIVGLLLGGMLVPLSAQMEQRNISDTRKALDDIQQALIGFAIINGRLPCPADGTTPAGGLNAAVPPVPAGQEYRDPVTGRCSAAIIVSNNNAMGVLPWATLGLNETDAWGRRYTYQVTANWADGAPAPDGTPGATCNVTVGISFQLCSNPTLDVRTAANPGGISLTPNFVPAVVVSHGKNGYGAYTPSGGTPLPPSPDADELENSDPDVHFVSKSPTPTFDDLVVWISTNILFNRMVAAGKLP